MFSERPQKSFKEFFIEMPEGGDDVVFARQEQGRGGERSH
jgi:hypothetical protein